MPQAKRNVRNINRAILVAYGLIALTLVYWSVVRADWLAARDDNPRGIEAELRTQRGTIFDVNGKPLVQSIGDGRVERIYAEGSGAAVGYYSPRFGTLGVERGLDAHLSGADESSAETFIRDMRHAPRTGRDVRLTINDNWQQAASDLLAGEKGGIVLLSLSNMSLRTLASAPTYDPNVLDEQFAVLSEDVDAPLLNRPIQGQYQPGLALEPFLLADLVNRRAVQLEGFVNAPNTGVRFGGQTLQCQTDVGITAAWSVALAETCPAPLLRLSDQFSLTDLQTLYTNFGFYRQPELAFAVEGETLPILLPDEIDRALLGQDTLTVTPLQLAVAWAALAQDGKLNQPHLVAALENEAGIMVTRLYEDEGAEAVEAWAAARILEMLPSSGVAIEHRALAIADEQGNTTAWYMGLFPASQPRYALVVVLEESGLEAVGEIGRTFARAVLESR